MKKYLTQLLFLIRKYSIFISILLLFTLLLSFYIQRRYVDVPFLDGLGPIPLVDKFFKKTLTLQDINMKGAEHLLIGYALIYLFNASIFGLNMKIEPYIFLFCYFMIGIIIFISYKKLFSSLSIKNINWIQISYIPILFIIFSLVHPPGELMTTQFVIGTLFFSLMAFYMDKIFTEKSNFRYFISYIVSVILYIVFFSSAYLVGALVSILFGSILWYFLKKNKQNRAFVFLGSIITILLSLWYINNNQFSGYNGQNLITKLVVFLTDWSTTLKSIIAGISASTLDIHTYSERLGNHEIILLLNGIILMIIGIYSFYIYFKNKIYERSFFPLFLCIYSLTTIATIRLGRSNGGWLQPINDWYSFHLYFYLVAILEILFSDFLIKNKNNLTIKKMSIWISGNRFYFFSILASIVIIFFMSLISNINKWDRAKYEKEWLEAKRQAILFPDNKSLGLLLWDKKASLAAIEIMKKYKLSVFRQSNLDNIIKSSEWNSDGWIGKNARALLVSKDKGELWMSVYVPKVVFSKIYKNSLILQIIIDGRIMEKRNFLSGSFDKGPVSLTLNIPKNKILSLGLKLDKSYVPAKWNLGKDLRELGIVIEKLDVK